jgi:hypothetical protein
MSTKRVVCKSAAEPKSRARIVTATPPPSPITRSTTTSASPSRVPIAQSVKEALDVFPHISADSFEGSPLQAECKKLSPSPDAFPSFVTRVLAIDPKPHGFCAAKLKVSTIISLVNDFFEAKPQGNWAGAGGQVRGTTKARASSASIGWAPIKPPVQSRASHTDRPRRRILRARKRA